MGLTLAFVKVSMDAKHSRRRLKQLENDESFGDRLMNVLKQLDKDMEDAIADIIDESGLEPVSEAAAAGPTVTSAPHFSPALTPTTSSAPTPAPAVEAKVKAEAKTFLKRKKCIRQSSSQSSGFSSSENVQNAATNATTTTTTTTTTAPKVKPSIADGRTPGGPMLSDLQLKLIENLNQLPFHKHTAHFPGMFSSHAIIISRDVKRFEFHKKGEGVLRHWADHFIL
jgi:hypothetical protein